MELVTMVEREDNEETDSVLTVMVDAANVDT
jgi:hypothetical protein